MDTRGKIFLVICYYFFLIAVNCLCARQGTDTGDGVDAADPEAAGQPDGAFSQRVRRAGRG